MPLREDVLFIHEDSGFDPPNRILLIPMGVFALADLLDREGIRTRIVHKSIERTLDPGFDPVARIRASGCRIVCLDLHWHQQAHRVLDLAKRIKRALPRTSIVLGGFTASFFHREIMARFPQVDFVVRGDAELPLLALARAVLAGGKGLSKVPNLSYRSRGKPRVNPLSYALDRKVFDGLRYARFELLDHHRSYNRQEVGWGELRAEGRSSAEGRSKGWFYFNPGRGCPHTCSPCGGSARSHALLRGKRGVLYKSVPSVLRDLEEAVAHGHGTWVVNFDPSPRKAYFLKVFAGIRKRKLPLDLRFAVMTLPSRAFIESAARTFGKVTLDFVLQTGSEEVRRRNKSVFLSDADLFAAAGRVQRFENVHLEFCLGVGWAFERREHIPQTLAFIAEVRKRCDRVMFVPLVLDMEPAAPWHLAPEKYGVKSDRRTIEDFMRKTEKRGELGFRKEDFSGEDLLAVAECYRAEARCSRPRSLMLETLLASPGRLGGSLTGLHRLCAACAEYGACFKKPRTPSVECSHAG